MLGIPRSERLDGAEHVKLLVKAIETYLGRFLLWVACVLLAALLYAQKTATPGAWDAGDWEAIAAVLTAFIAFAAISVAVVQLQDARNLRWEQALPYIAAYLDPDPTDPRLIYLAIKNYGTTVATEIQLEMTPVPMRSNKLGGGELSYPRQLPALVPGQEWRTFWDFSPSRFQDKLENDYVLCITFLDSRGVDHSVSSALGWKPYTDGRRWIGRKSVHHIGEAMKKMEKSVASIADNTTPPSIAGGGMSGPLAPPMPASGEVLAAFGIVDETDDDGTQATAAAPVDVSEPLGGVPNPE